MGLMDKITGKVREVASDAADAVKKSVGPEAASAAPPPPPAAEPPPPAQIPPPSSGVRKTAWAQHAGDVSATGIMGKINDTLSGLKKKVTLSDSKKAGIDQKIKDFGKAVDEKAGALFAKVTGIETPEREVAKLNSDGDKVKMAYGGDVSAWGVKGAHKAELEITQKDVPDPAKPGKTKTVYEMKLAAEYGGAVGKEEGKTEAELGGKGKMALTWQFDSKADLEKGIKSLNAVSANRAVNMMGSPKVIDDHMKKVQAEQDFLSSKMQSTELSGAAAAQIASEMGKSVGASGELGGEQSVGVKILHNTRPPKMAITTETTISGSGIGGLKIPGNKDSKGEEKGIGKAGVMLEGELKVTTETEFEIPASAKADLQKNPVAAFRKAAAAAQKTAETKVTIEGKGQAQVGAKLKAGTDQGDEVQAKQKLAATGEYSFSIELKGKSEDVNAALAKMRKSGVKAGLADLDGKVEVEGKVQKADITGTKGKPGLKADGTGGTFEYEARRYDKTTLVEAKGKPSEVWRKMFEDKK